MKPLNVVVVTKDGCMFCDIAMTMLNRLSAEYPLVISTLSAHSAEGQALALKCGILFPPGIVLDDEPLCYGRPSERKLRRAFEQKLS
ncbi:thioredoxin family protein [Paraburkholderia fungorum]|uniref:Glutaredoxin n=1 Tax=Paraburkholderia fungorum TaxID=134537 RepID=A0A3R7GNS0_9BURK|nr:thioredoxin family protein [Paraburkholderia fungorum]RKF35736.1 glutaredoxin [Paraburkholderia fungorum]